MQAENRNILLILDNASSHNCTGLTLNSITILMLLPNMTSEIQPMDAGIIAAFKCHYRRRHSQAAVNKVDRGERNIYTVHVLQAMAWSRRAWASIESAKIRNCFNHTNLMGPSNEIPSIDQHLQEAFDDIDHNLSLLPKDLWIPREGFIDPVGENGSIHIQLSDTELLALPIDGTDRMDKGNGEDEGQEEEEEDEEQDDEPPLPSRAEILAAIDLTMQYIDGDLGPIEYPECF